MLRILPTALAAALALALPSAASAGSLVDMSRTGGLLGGLTTTSIDAGGRGVQKETRFGTRTSFTVPPGPLAGLTARLRGARFATLGQYPVPPGTTDAQVVHITHDGATVDASWQPPKRLSKAVDAVRIAGERGADVLHYVDGTDADNPIYLSIRTFNRDRYSAPALKSLRRALAKLPVDTRLTDPDAATKGVRLSMGYTTVTASSLERLPIGVSAREALLAVLNRS